MRAASATTYATPGILQPFMSTETFDCIFLKRINTLLSGQTHWKLYASPQAGSFCIALFVSPQNLALGTKRLVEDSEAAILWVGIFEARSNLRFSWDGWYM